MTTTYFALDSIEDFEFDPDIDLDRLLLDADGAYESDMSSIRSPMVSNRKPAIRSAVFLSEVRWLGERTS